MTYKTKYSHVILGGTFDRLHRGHQKLLDTAFDSGEKVWLGITTDEFAENKNNLSLPSLVEKYADRLSSVKQFLGRNRLRQAQIIPLGDRFGSTLSDKQLEAIIVSPETKPVAEKINKLRKQKRFLPLNIITLSWELAEDGQPISSIRIRTGEIDRSGKVYQLPQDWGVRYLPTSLRLVLRKPIGKLLKDTKKHHVLAVEKLQASYLADQKSCLLIAVGDAASSALLKQDIIPDISIVDFHIQRKRIHNTLADIGFRDINILKKAKNIAGTLSHEAYQALFSLLRSEAKPSILQINGEEDLLALLAMFLAPLDSLIIYGQPNEGLVVVQVSEKIKQKSREYLDQFIPSKSS